MKREKITELILKEKIVAIIRLKFQDEVADVLDTLIKGGIKVLEITSNTPGYLEEIKKARIAYPDVLIGAGTIANTILAKEAMAAGAQFLVSPNTDAEIVKAAHLNDVPVLMGALTPTEIHVADAAGADVIKLFPAGAMGIDYFKAIKGPFSTVKFFAVGNIGLDNAKKWMEAGMLGIGLGSSLAKPVKNKTDIENTIMRAKQFRELVR